MSVDKFGYSEDVRPKYKRFIVVYHQSRLGYYVIDLNTCTVIAEYTNSATARLRAEAENAQT